MSLDNQEKTTNNNIENVVKPKRGRPRKNNSESSILKTKPEKKLSLAEKQELKLKAQQEKQAAKGSIEPKNKERFYCTNKELQAELVKWRDSAEKVEDRIISEELGRMIMAIGNKLLNHSSFRNYPKEMKEDMLGQYFLKLIKGLKNYNFKFNNPFAFFTTAAFNSYLIVINKHYKQQNIKKDLMAKLVTELETFQGISSESGLAKCIKSYIDNAANYEN